MVQRQQIRQSHRTNHASVSPWFWQILLVAAFIGPGLTSEGLACHTVTLNPTSLTYNAVQGATNPTNQTVTVSRTSTRQTTLTASDNASWLSESPTIINNMTTKATLTVAVNTSGIGASPPPQTITIKVGTWCSYAVPVTLSLSPSPTSTTTTPTKSATLTWNAVTSTAVSGYKVYVGEAPHLYTRTINVGTATSSTISSLTVGKMYYFAITAYNSAGESPPSTEVSKTIQ